MSIDPVELDAPNEVGGEAKPVAPIREEDPITEVALEALEKTESPNPKDKIEAEVTEPPANAEKVQELAIRTFPDPAKESLDALIRIEALRGQEIANKEKEANGFMKNVDRLLDLTAELSALPQEEKVSFTDRIKEILAELKTQGIDLWKDEKTIDIAKERITELKSLVSSQTDKCNKKVTVILTKIQSIAQDLMAFLESAKAIHRDDSRAKATFTRNQRISA